MSYGVWKKSGKGWATCEIDSPSSRDFSRMRMHNPAKYKRLQNDCNALDVYFDDYYCDPNQLRWECTQRAKGYKVIDFNIGGGEHQTWIAYDGSRCSLMQAIEKGTHADAEETRQIIDMEERELSKREQLPERFHTDTQERLIQTERALSALHTEIEDMIRERLVWKRDESNREAARLRKVLDYMKEIGLDQRAR